jgi:DNA-binding XRE family transcriptional regulator
VGTSSASEIAIAIKQRIASQLYCQIMTVTRRNNKLFGEVLRSHRLEKQLTQEQLSERVDVIRAFISALENGTRQPSLAMILRLAKALEIKPGKLVDAVAEKMEQK